MERILIVSVGGSPAPIINAIKFYRPDLVYFFCSSGPKGSAVAVDGPGDPCGDRRKSRCPKCGHEYFLGDPKGKAIVVQTGLREDQYEIVGVEDPDDLNGCYAELTALSERIRESHPDAQIIANYTGGTKTMSVSMALVGTMTQEWDLSLNKGPRVDIIKVKTGDTPVVVDKWRIFGERQLGSAAEALRNYDYALAEAMVSESLLHPLEPGFEKKLLRIRQVCTGFNCWDRFDHEKALELLQPYGRDFSPYLITLKRILQPTKGTGYERVSDLLGNAERRAVQKRYDDAVARLYRAMELFAQIRLEKTKGYTLGKLNVDQLDEPLRPEYSKYAKEGGKLWLGLREDYELLHKLGDPLGDAFKKKEEEILNALSYRNASIFAHGITPLGEEEYRRVSDRLKGFILEVSGKIGLNLEPSPFPREKILKG